MVIVLVRQVAEAVTCDRAGAQNDVAKEYEDEEAGFALGLILCFGVVHVLSRQIQ
jgi:hypothetical protein